MSRKVLLVNDRADLGKSYYLPFSFIGPRCDDLNLIDTNPKSIALVVFTGGADVNPDLYNEQVGKKTHCDLQRDTVEIKVFDKAMEHGLPMFGICRGCQFLTVMMGGRLVQHVTNHHTPHKMITKEGAEFEVSSSHHQMCLPHPQDDVLAWASPSISKVYLDGKNQGIPVTFEVEAVHFADYPIVGVQYHPEIMPTNSPGFNYIRYLIKKYILSIGI